ncbi:MAG: HAMP domain-containing sensor histidine kinase [Planctomycetota bacterium]
MQPPRAPYLLLLLALGSAAGLVIGAALSLWGALGEARARAAVEARLAAQQTARVLRAALRDPALLAEVAEARRFVVRDGAVVVPPDLGALDPGAVEGPGFGVAHAMRRARGLERSDPAKARSLLEALRVQESLNAADTARVDAQLGWLALRAGDRQAAADAVAPPRRLGANPASIPPDALASRLLLAAHLDGAVPQWAAGAVTRLPPATAAQVLVRMADRGLPVAPLRRACRAAAVRRAVLRLARWQQPVWEGTTEPTVVQSGSQLLVYHPRDGSGAVLAGQPLVDVLVAHLDVQQDGVAALAANQLVAGPAPSALAVPVYPGALAVLPRRVAAGGWASRGVAPIVLLAALGAVFVIALLAAVRGLRREGDALRARAEFLTSVTHELKTPLASVRLLAEMLQEGRVAGAERQREYHRMIASEAMRLSVLIENVLDLGRMERGERAYDLQSGPLVEAVRDTVTLFAPVAERAGLRLDVQLDLRRVTARFDRDALVQALFNVLDNARKYGAGGGVIELEGERNGAAYHVRVRDRGPGVAAAERELVFERFRRGARQADGSTPGLGLGLPLARAILRAHGGDLRLDPAASDRPGACFCLTVPLESLAAEAPS